MHVNLIKREIICGLKLCILLQHKILIVLECFLLYVLVHNYIMKCFSGYSTLFGVISS